MHVMFVFTEMLIYMKISCAYILHIQSYRHVFEELWLIVQC